MTVPAARTAQRLQRILVLVPYAIAHPGVSIGELAERFGSKEKDLIDDLNLLFMCGLPGYGPGDLIDVDIDEGNVYVRMADYFAAPLKLTPIEALSLYAGAAALQTLPGMEGADALARAITKLGRALGAGDDGGSPLSIRFETGPDQHLEALNRALEERRRIRMHYFSASRAELTQREVDPWGLYAALGRWYLIGFDHSRSEERMFRVDRIKSISLTDERSEIPPDVDLESYRAAFRPGRDTRVASFEISPRAARWFGEYYPLRSTTTRDDAWVRVEIEYSSAVWLARLIVSLGPDVRAIQPGEAADAARALARDILELYERG
ncbi:MAG: WYL domain-containing protein [Actinomycetota bacterium]|nr:WYL domain-containing protein [Actinomycetota bacterium]